MTDGFLELDAAANDPALLAAESEGRPAFVVDGDGDVVWAGDAAFRLIGVDALDDGTRRALSRMARSGAGGLLRLRFGDAPLRFRARAIRLDGEGGLLALEGLFTPEASPAATAGATPTPVRDVAAEEGIAEIGAAPAETTAVQETAFQEAAIQETAAQETAAEAFPAARPADEVLDAGEATHSAEASDDAPSDEAARLSGEVGGETPPTVAGPDLFDSADDLPPDPRRALRPVAAHGLQAPSNGSAEPVDISGDAEETFQRNALASHDAPPDAAEPDVGASDPVPVEADASDASAVEADAGETPAAVEGAGRSAPDPEVEAPAPVAALFEPFRFSFELDGQSRLTFLSPELRRAVGSGADAAIGRDWDGLAADLGLDPAGAVSAALARRGAWSDLQISWPLGDGRRAPLSLSALPMFDNGRSFAGHRGLGRSIGEPADENVADESGPTELAPTAGLGPVEPPPAPEPADGDVAHEFLTEPAGASDETTQAETPQAETTQAKTTQAKSAPAGAEPPERHEPPILVEFKPEPPSFSGNVVPLRETPPPAPRLPTLSSSEENAFDEIARRLQGLSQNDVDRTSDDGILDGGISRTVLDEDTLSAAAEAAARFVESEETQRALPFAAGSDELLRLLDRLPLGALVLRGGDVAHANRAALDLLGCREIGELAGRGPDTLFAEALPQDRDAPAGVTRLISANGGEVEVEARLSTIAWGGAPATLVTLRRPDASLAAARETEQREKEAAAALDVATDGVMTLDGAGRILSVNRGAQALFGFEAREVIGSLFTLSLAPESRKAAFDSLDGLKSGDAPASEGVEVLGLSRQGGALPLLMTMGRIAPDAAGRYCAVLRDIGPWKRAEEELIAARRQAERANAQKSEFLAKVGHEIRTPLNAIIGFAEVMMEERFGPVGSPRYKDYLKDIHTSGGHLVKMVDDLLDISRIETGKLKLDFGPVDLNEIASQAAALLQTQANRDHVIIRTSLARGLPPVLADRRSIRQIMTNLAANAVKLSRPGGQVIVATALTDGGQAVFRVRDAGAGMSKQEIARAFEPFRPLAVADNDTGFGLGLPLTRALAEANEAALALQSELGRGTLAEVTFPASRVLAG